MLVEMMDGLALSFMIVVDLVLALIFVSEKGVAKYKTAYAPLVASLITVAIVGLAGHYSSFNLFIAVAFALLSSMLVMFYVSSTRNFLLLMVFLSLQLVYIASVGVPLYSTFAPGFAIGTFFGLAYIEKVKKRGNAARGVKKTEIDRDVFSMVLGAVLLLLLAAFSKTFSYIAIALIILAYSFNAVVSRRSLGAFKPVLRMLKGLERKDAFYGTGALYLAVGFTLLLAFAGAYRFLAFGIAVLLFADSAATIVGERIPIRKLPYNASKSIGGFTGFFVVTAISAFILFGAPLIAIVYAVVLAFIESLDLRIDDNVTLAVGVIAIYALQLV